MSQSTIRLHQVEPGRGLPADGLERVRRQRLHLFPGRALGEDEFDRAVVTRGTNTVLADNQEIAHVLGDEGLRSML